MTRAKLTPEEKEERKKLTSKRHNERYRERLLEMTPEELKQFRLKQKAKRDRFLSKRTDEEKANANEKAKYHMRSLRASWDSKRKQADKEWHFQWAQKMSPERLEQERARGRNNRRLLKDQIIRHYSNGEMRCVCPSCEVPGGAKDFDSLTLDHINGGGRKHNAEIESKGFKGGIYRWVLKNNFPPIFQVYCWNCNNKKRMVNKENYHIESNDDGRQKQREKARQILRREKELVIAHYSKGVMHCMNPNCEVPGGVKDLDSLNIDHINGGGKQHMKELKAIGVHNRFNTWLVKNNFPDIGLQVLCWNCNNRKRKINREDHYAVKGVRGTQHLSKEEKVKLEGNSNVSEA